MSTTHLSERGALLARLEHSKLGPGQYLVEGYHVERCRPAPFPWLVEGGEANGVFPTLTDALRWIDYEVHGA